MNDTRRVAAPVRARCLTDLISCERTSSSRRSPSSQSPRISPASPVTFSSNATASGVRQVQAPCACLRALSPCTNPWRTHARCEVLSSGRRQLATRQHVHVSPRSAHPVGDRGGARGWAGDRGGRRRIIGRRRPAAGPARQADRTVVPEHARPCMPRRELDRSVGCSARTPADRLQAAVGAGVVALAAWPAGSISLAPRVIDRVRGTTRDRGTRLRSPAGLRPPVASLLLS